MVHGGQGNQWETQSQHGEPCAHAGNQLPKGTNDGSTGQEQTNKQHRISKVNGFKRGRVDVVPTWGSHWQRKNNVGGPMGETTGPCVLKRRTSRATGNHVSQCANDHLRPTCGGDGGSDQGASRGRGGGGGPGGARGRVQRRKVVQPGEAHPRREGPAASFPP